MQIVASMNNPRVYPGARLTARPTALAIAAVLPSLRVHLPQAAKSAGKNSTEKISYFLLFFYKKTGKYICKYPNFHVRLYLCNWNSERTGWRFAKP
jgi:hypothetical protein